jgi:hypothetical protein
VLPALLFLLPFEPRTPVLALGPLHVTLLEGVALLAVTVSWPGRSTSSSSWRERLPLLLLGAYAAAHLLSAALTDVAPGRAFRFALRMVAMATLAAVVSAAPAQARESALIALCAGGVLAAGLAIAEAQGVRALDPFLAAFREQPFNTGGLRRATAGSEYPNLAGACLAYALLAGSGWAAGRRLPTVVVALAAAFLSAGLLATSSRGALLAAGFGLAALAAVTRDALARRPALVALAVLGACSLVYLHREQVMRLRLGSEGVSSWYGAAYEPLETSLRLAPLAETRTAVRVTNLGQHTWTRVGAFHLSHHWYTAQGLVTRDGARTPLPRDVAPRETVLVDAVVVAPALPGEYTLLWDMVQEHTAWFSGQGVAPARVSVKVEGGPVAAPVVWPDADAGLESAGWRPGRRELWSLALLLWRERPLTGVGSDNFRWLYGARAGRAPGDTRIYANNLLLEALATTGLLGALALLATLVVSLHWSWRAARRTGAAEARMATTLVGLLTVVAVHGMVDYVLAFTGHYILLGFVVGAAAASPGPPERS